MGRTAWSAGYFAGIFLLLSRKELGGNIFMQEKGEGDIGNISTAKRTGPWTN
jgi:hypothetical protein